MIRSGEHELVVTGGMESMSNAPYLLPKARFGYRLGNGEVVDHVVFDGLTSTFDGLHMIEQASFVARELGITREEQDEWAYRSHQRAAAAQDEGRFADEIVTVGDLTADEGVRRDTTLEKLSALKPVFDPDGTTTAGNAPGVNDGASCVIVCSEAFAARRGLEPLATILAQGYVADEYAYLARTPARAGEQALAKAGKTIDDVARVEINEAFASVAKNSTRTLGADEEIVNVNGGAVALGHPIGASGGRIVSTLIDDLRRSAAGSGWPRSARAAARATRFSSRSEAAPPHRIRRARLREPGSGVRLRRGARRGAIRRRGRGDRRSGRGGACGGAERSAPALPHRRGRAARQGATSVARSRSEPRPAPTATSRSRATSPSGCCSTAAPDGAWLATACSVVILASSSSREVSLAVGPIKVVVGVVILGLVLLVGVAALAQGLSPRSPWERRGSSRRQSCLR